MHVAISCHCHIVLRLYQHINANSNFIDKFVVMTDALIKKSQHTPVCKLHFALKNELFITVS